jgi:hypothetical protein
MKLGKKIFSKSAASFWASMIRNREINQRGAQRRQEKKKKREINKNNKYELI